MEAGSKPPRETPGLCFPRTVGFRRILPDPECLKSVPGRSRHPRPRVRHGRPEGVRPKVTRAASPVVRSRGTPKARPQQVLPRPKARPAHSSPHCRQPGPLQAPRAPPQVPLRHEANAREAPARHRPVPLRSWQARGCARLCPARVPIGLPQRRLPHSARAPIARAEQPRALLKGSRRAPPPGRRGRALLVCRPIRAADSGTRCTRWPAIPKMRRFRQCFRLRKQFRGWAAAAPGRPGPAPRRLRPAVRSGADFLGAHLRCRRCPHERAQLRASEAHAPAPPRSWLERRGTALQGGPLANEWLTFFENSSADDPNCAAACSAVTVVRREGGASVGR